MDLEERRRRGESARRILDEPVFQDAFADLRSHFIEAWQQCADQEQRDRIWMAVNLLKKIEQHIETVFEDGKLAAAEIAELRKANGQQN